MESILKLQADICKVFANDKRLGIINLLKDEEMSNSELMQKTGLSKVTMISTHECFKVKRCHFGHGVKVSNYIIGLPILK